MTLLEVIDTARGIINEPLDSSRTFPDNTSSFWGDGILTTYHNLVQQEVQQEVIQSFEDYYVTQTTINVVGGVAAYTLPTDMIKLKRVEDLRDPNDPVEILPIKWSERGSDVDLLVQSSILWGGGYYFRGNQIVFDVTPNFTQGSAVTLSYVQRIADVTAATSTSAIPAEHHRVLVWGIVKLALFQQQSDTTLAVREYERQLDMMKKQIENRQIQRPRRVARTKGSWG